MHKINTDCYYFYNTSCAKGNLCPYRHEASAVGCIDVCQEWLNGACNNFQCSFRHTKSSPLTKAQTQCYWENSSSGCLKTSCPFLHSKKQHSGIPVNANVHVIVNLDDTEESEDDQEDEEKQNNTKKNKTDDVANGSESNNPVVNTKNRIVLPINKEQAKNQSIPVLSGRKPVSNINNLQSDDLRRELTSGYKTNQVSTHVHFEGLYEPSICEKRLNRLKRFLPIQDEVVKKKSTTSTPLVSLGR